MSNRKYVSCLVLKKIGRQKTFTPNVYLLQATSFLMRTSKNKHRKINQDKLYNVIKFFLAQGTDPNCRPNQYWPLPLYYAVNNDNKRLTRLLLLYGANPNERIIDFDGPQQIFSFEKGEPRGWLRNMYNTMQMFKIIRAQK